MPRPTASLLLAALIGLAACAEVAAVREVTPPSRPARVIPHDDGPRLYLSPAGDDASPCTETAPCRTIPRALAGAAPGTTLLLAEGHYPSFELRNLHGAEGRPITLRAPSRAAVIDPGEARDTIFVVRSSHLVLDGLRSYGAKRAALRVSGSQYVTVRNSTFGDNERWGIFTDFSDDFTAERNEVYGSKKEHGIYVSNSGDRPMLRFNFLHDNIACGLQINADEETRDLEQVYPGTVDGLTTSALVDGNLLFRNGQIGGAAINLDGVQESQIVNNLLVDNLARGIVAYGDADGIPGDGLSGLVADGNGHRGPSGLLIANNTVVSRAASARRGALLLRYSHGARPNLVTDNVLFHEGQPSIELGGGDDLALLDSRQNLLERVTLAERDLPLSELGAHDRGSVRSSLAELFPTFPAATTRAFDALARDAQSLATKRVPPPGAPVPALLDAFRGMFPDAFR